MASLKPALPPGHWKKSWSIRNYIEIDPSGQMADKQADHQCQSYNEHMGKEGASLKALDPEKLWSTPVADGEAYYLVNSQRPLILIHVPYGDAYRASEPLIRGLKLSDMDAEIKRKQRIREFINEHRQTAAEGNHTAP